MMEGEELLDFNAEIERALSRAIDLDDSELNISASENKKSKESAESRMLEIDESDIAKPSRGEGRPEELLRALRKLDARFSSIMKRLQEEIARIRTEGDHIPSVNK